MEEKKEILVVSFGTSDRENCDLTIGAIEHAVKNAFSGFEVRRAFSCQRVIDILKERDNLEIDTVEQALERAMRQGIDTLIVQPTHLLNGSEYKDMAAVLDNHKDKFKALVLSQVLLSSDSDFENMAEALVRETGVFDNAETAICFMGHGTECGDNEVYAKLQNILKEKGHGNYFIGTMKGACGAEEICTCLDEEGNYRKVILFPLMIVAGIHAQKEMAGEEADSWKHVFAKAGYEVECVKTGLGQYRTVQDLYIKHIEKALQDVCPIMSNSHRFFANKACEYYPCHEGIAELNCLFCYCPLYRVEHCPGKPEYTECNGEKIKDCSNCTFPHKAQNYDKILERLMR